MLTKAVKQTLIEKHILCFGKPPIAIMQTPGRIEWFGSYAAYHGGYTLSSAINQYLSATVGENQQGNVRIFSTGFPAMTVSLNALTITPEERYTALAYVKGVLLICLQQGYVLPQGMDMFIQSDLTKHQNLGSSSAFALTLLEGIRCLQPKPSHLELTVKARWVKEIEHYHVGQTSKISDTYPMLLGGTVFLDHHKFEEPLYQHVTNRLTDYRLLLLKVSSSMMNPRLLSKHILDQMSIIAQHYQQSRLIDVDRLDFQHDVTELTRMYGIKTTQKATYFFQEQQRTQVAFLAFEKGDQGTWNQQLALSEQATEIALEHTIVPGQTEQKLAATKAWIKRQCPDITARIHGLGFQGPLLLIIPKTTYGSIYTQLKRQFYESSLTEIQIVNTGIRVSKI